MATTTLYSHSPPDFGHGGVWFGLFLVTIILGFFSSSIQSPSKRGWSSANFFYFSFSFNFFFPPSGSGAPLRLPCYGVTLDGTASWRKTLKKKKKALNQTKWRQSKQNQCDSAIAYSGLATLGRQPARYASANNRVGRNTLHRANLRNPLCGAPPPLLTRGESLCSDTLQLSKALQRLEPQWRTIVCFLFIQ